MFLIDYLICAERRYITYNYYCYSIHACIYQLTYNLASHRSHPETGTRALGCGWRGLTSFSFFSLFRDHCIAADHLAHPTKLKKKKTIKLIFESRPFFSQKKKKKPTCDQKQPNYVYLHVLRIKRDFNVNAFYFGFACTIFRQKQNFTLQPFKTLPNRNGMEFK